MIQQLILPSSILIFFLFFLLLHGKMENNSKYMKDIVIKDCRFLFRLRTQLQKLRYIDFATNHKCATLYRLSSLTPLCVYGTDTLALNGVKYTTIWNWRIEIYCLLTSSDIITKPCFFSIAFLSFTFIAMPLQEARMFSPLPECQILSRMWIKWNKMKWIEWEKENHELTTKQTKCHTHCGKINGSEDK